MMPTVSSLHLVISTVAGRQSVTPVLCRERRHWSRSNI